MALVVGLTLLGVLLFLVQEVLRRAGKCLAWGPFLVVPIVLTPYWVRSNYQVEIFLWFKLYTILFGACWITGLRYTSLGRSPWPLLGVIVLLVINVLEAVVQDVLGGTLAHYLVAISGVLLLLSLPNQLHAIRIAEDGYRDLIYRDMTRPWIVAYTVWNAAFVYLNFPIVAGHHLGVLAAALVVGMHNPRRWLMSRTYTLAFDMLLLATFREPLTGVMDTTHWLTPAGADLVALLCLGAVACCSAHIVVDYGIGSVRSRAAGPRPALTQLPALGPRPRRDLSTGATLERAGHAERRWSSSRCP